MEHYRASIFYSEETVKVLDATLQKTFHFWRSYVLLAVCVFLLGIGVRLDIRTTPGLITILVGCLLAPYAAGYTFPSAAARSSLEFMKGKKFLMEYSFNAADFVCTVGKSNTTYKYTDIIRLIEHKEFLYLCISQNQACMLERISISPHDEANFKAFIADKVGLAWTRRPSLLALSFRTLRFNRQNTRNP